MPNLLQVATSFARKLRKAALLSSEPEWRRGLRLRTAATIEHDRLPLHHDYPTVIDVGANKGQFALYSRVRFPRARVYSLEPLSGPRKSMQKLFRSDDAVQLIPFAAGAASGRSRIFVSGRDDSSSLLETTSLQTERFPGTQTVATEDIEVRSLDELFDGSDWDGPVLLKLDVQGFELEALRGGIELLSHVDTVLCECSFVAFYEGQALFEDIQGFLSAQGFYLSGGAISATAANRWEQGDFVFERGDVRRRAAA